MEFDLARPYHPAVRNLLESGWWRPALVLVVSVLYEIAFLAQSVNVIDEGWPLYAAQQLHQGGVLYRDVFFVFPPGHVLAAWLGYAIDPPGLFVTRIFYALFNVALCLALYALGRRLMPPSFALLAAVLVAVAAPDSHAMQLLFGYRYLVFSALGLLAFARRLESGDPRWMVAAGAAIGFALCFRLTPAFAASCGIALAVMTATRSPRAWLVDWSLFATGLLLVTAPVVLWLAAGAGLPALWTEIVARPLLMTELQSVPAPPLQLPVAWTREAFIDAYFPLMFRLPVLLYAGYLFALGALWVRALRNRAPYPHALLLATTLWGAIFFLRTGGRTDVPHLESALPPVCLLLAHALGLAFGRLPLPAAGWRRSAATLLFFVASLGAWVFVQESERVWRRPSLERRVRRAAELLRSAPQFFALSMPAQRIWRLTKPGDRILDMSATPIFHLLTERRGPGYADILMPGTFFDTDEEIAFLARIEREPPALVVMPAEPFDGIPERAIERVAPLLSGWVNAHYREVSRSERFILLLPQDDPRAKSQAESDS